MPSGCGLTLEHKCSASNSEQQLAIDFSQPLSQMKIAALLALHSSIICTSHCACRDIHADSSWKNTGPSSRCGGRVFRFCFEAQGLVPFCFAFLSSSGFHVLGNVHHYRAVDSSLTSRKSHELFPRCVSCRSWRGPAENDGFNVWGVAGADVMARCVSLLRAFCRAYPEADLASGFELLVLSLPTPLVWPTRGWGVAPKKKMIYLCA